MSDVVNAELRHTIVEATNILFNLGQESGSGSRLTVRERECINDVRVRLEALSLALPGLQAEAPEDARKDEIEIAKHILGLIFPKANDADFAMFVERHGVHIAAIIRADRNAARTSQAEAQAPTTAAQASVAPEACVPGMWHCPKCKLILTAKFIDQATCTVGMNDEPQRCLNECGPMWRYTWKAYAEDMEARAVEQLERAKKAEAALAATAGAPAPATTMPSVNLYTDATLDKADNLYIELSWQHHINMPISERRDRILTLIAKGDTPAPTHAPNCGYWLDLNCSCGLEGDTP